jgi:hypothetical protein
MTNTLTTNTGINFRTATARTGTQAGSVDTALPIKKLTDTPSAPDQPGRGRLPRWIAPVGIAAALCAVGIVAAMQRTESDPAPVQVDAPAEVITNLGPNADLAPRTAIEPSAGPVVNLGPNADLPVDQSVRSVGTQRPVVWSGAPACRTPADRGPNADLALSTSPGAVSTRNLGPNADLPFDHNGMRSSGSDPICTAG